VQRRQFLLTTALAPVGATVPWRTGLHASEPGWEYDGVATVARLGVLTPDFDPVPESELWAMAPRGVSLHTARVPRGGGRGAGFVTEGPIDAAVDRLVELSPRAILLGYTSSSYALGAKADEQVRNRLEQRAKGLSLIFTCPAAMGALRKLGVKRLALVHPPWWTDQANADGRAYWRAAGFEVLECARVEPLRSFSEVPPKELFEFVRTRTPSRAEAVFIGGNGMRAVGAVRALETQLAQPVLTANQVLLWDALQRFGHIESVSRYGSIFTGRLPAKTSRGDS
jgi:maleate isomerase